MPGSAEEISNYAFKDTDELLFDANVWFYLNKGFMLVTDDRDFKGRDITVLTANKRLLA